MAYFVWVALTTYNSWGMVLQVSTCGYLCLTSKITPFYTNLIQPKEKGKCLARIHQNINLTIKGMILYTYSSRISGSPRPNKEWSLVCSMEQRFPILLATAIHLVNLDFLDILYKYNLYIYIYASTFFNPKKNPEKLQGPLI